MSSHYETPILNSISPAEDEKYLKKNREAEVLLILLKMKHLWNQVGTHL